MILAREGGLDDSSPGFVRYLLRIGNNNYKDFHFYASSIFHKYLFDMFASLNITETSVILLA